MGVGHSDSSSYDKEEDEIGHSDSSSYDEEEDE